MIGQDSRRPQHVLVVEDQTVIAKGLSSKLSYGGYSIAGPFTRGAEALAWLGARSPDAAILDARLQDGTCLAVARELQQRGIPFVFFSGSDDLQPHLAGTFPDAAWVSKPARYEQFLDVLRRSLSLRDAAATGPCLQRGQCGV